MKQNCLIFFVFYLPLKLNVYHITLSTRYHSLGWERWMSKVYKISRKGCKGQVNQKSLSPGYSDLDRYFSNPQGQCDTIQKKLSTSIFISLGVQKTGKA